MPRGKSSVIFFSRSEQENAILLLWTVEDRASGVKQKLKSELEEIWFDFGERYIRLMVIKSAFHVPLIIIIIDIDDYDEDNENERQKDSRHLLRSIYQIHGQVVLLSSQSNSHFLVDNAFHVILWMIWNEYYTYFFLSELLFFGQALMFLFFSWFKPKNVH